jgi:hypothetical protein
MVRRNSGCEAAPMSGRAVAGNTCLVQATLQGGAAAEGNTAPQSIIINVTDELRTTSLGAALSFNSIFLLLTLVPFCNIVIFTTMSFSTTATIASFGGKLLKLSHKSTSTNTDMALNLFLPPQALKSGAKVPVLFYLSGLTCTGDNCSEKGFFQHGASEKGIAVVYPDTSPSMSDLFSGRKTGRRC